MTAPASNMRINADRLWDSLMEMAKIGPGVAGGNNRQTLTDDDAEGRALFQNWCETAGCTMGLDTMGNMFARFEGTDPDALPVYVGSHLDTQPTGGKYDGVLGVLGLIIIRGFLLELVHPVSLLRGFFGRLEARFAGALPLGVDAVEHGHLVDVFEVVAVVPDAVSSVEVRLVVARVEGVARGRELRYPRVGWRREVAEHHPLLAAEAREHGRVRGGVAAVDEAAVE